jgi:hypothetical protein
MLIRISLILAIVAGLAVGALNFVKVKETITTLRSDLASEKQARATAESNEQKATKAMNVAKAELEETNKVLVATITERDKAVTDATAQGKRATQLSEELAKTKMERDEAETDRAAYRATGYSPDQVMGLGKLLKQTQETLGGVQAENKVLGRKIERLNIRLAKYEGGGPPIVFLPANLSGKILVADPKWDFVVLNVGEEQGVKEESELLVNRGGKLVAKVIVRSVQKDRSIANVLPGWKLGELMEGDLVIPAHPAS